MCYCTILMWFLSQKFCNFVDLFPADRSAKKGQILLDMSWNVYGYILQLHLKFCNQKNKVSYALGWEFF